ncbi:hypothetical protein T484DRAFT_1874592 [Baffinella frigidus]|nr:hypothetical protein T484DRAFT_1874592 [Cryptophyta sp. CCMP2293]
MESASDFRVLWWGRGGGGGAAAGGCDFLIAGDRNVAIRAALSPNDTSPCHLLPGASSLPAGRAQAAVWEQALRLGLALEREPHLWSYLFRREVLVCGHGLGGGAAHLWTAQTLARLSWPLLFRSFHSLALGPPMVADAALASRVHAAALQSFESVFTRDDPIRTFPAPPLLSRYTL